MKRLTLLTVCAVVSLMFSCEKYVIPKVDVPTDVSYSADVQPIFDAKCVKCHKGSRNPDLRPENSYDVLINDGWVDTGSPESSTIYIKMAEGHQTATETESKTVLGWIMEGAENN